jgi:hypothetical protein
MRMHPILMRLNSGSTGSCASSRSGQLLSPCEAGADVPGGDPCHGHPSVHPGGVEFDWGPLKTFHRRLAGSVHCYRVTQQVLARARAPSMSSFKLLLLPWTESHIIAPHARITKHPQHDTCALLTGTWLMLLFKAATRLLVASTPPSHHHQRSTGMTARHSSRARVAHPGHPYPTSTLS